MSPRSRARSARTARPSRTPQHRIPIGLQIAARVVAGRTVNVAYLRDYLKTADEQAQRILHDPIAALEESGTLPALDAIANHFGSEALTEKIAGAIPASVTHDPRGLVSDLSICWQDAGLYLGLCLGFRIAASGAGKE